jgi:hypothetical protein
MLALGLKIHLEEVMGSMRLRRLELNLERLISSIAMT